MSPEETSSKNADSVLSLNSKANFLSKEATSSLVPCDV